MMANLRAVFPPLHCRGWVRGRQAKACGAPALHVFGRHVSLAFHQQLHYSDTTIVCGVDERGVVTVGVVSKKNGNTTEKNATSHTQSIFRGYFFRLFGFNFDANREGGVHYMPSFW